MRSTSTSHIPKPRISEHIGKCKCHSLFPESREKFMSNIPAFMPRSSMKKSEGDDITDGPESEPMCGGGWLIVGVGFMSDFVSMGGRVVIMIVIIYWEEEFGWSRAELSNLMALVHVCNGYLPT